MQFIIDCFKALWHCVGDPGTPSGPHPAPEINAASSVAVVALLLSVTAVVYRQWQQGQR